MSAIPSPAPISAPAARELVIPGALVTAGRTLMLLALALLVPGEAERISERL